MTTPSHKYGWRPDIPDHRDIKYNWSPFAAPLPSFVDLRDRCGEVLDQGSLGSCTAQALAQLHLFVQRKEQRSELFLPSRLFIYYNERREEGTIESDAGASIRTGIKTIAKYGVCKEQLWGYNLPMFSAEPDKECYEEAVKNKALKYRRIEGLDRVMGCLSTGYPVVFGFSVYSSFETPIAAKSGIIPIPRRDEKFYGGHAVMAVGYDTSRNHLIVMNSWGRGWGDEGYFYLPFEFVTNDDLSADYWTISDVE